MRIPGNVLASSDVLSWCRQHHWTGCVSPALQVTPSAVLVPKLVVLAAGVRGTAAAGAWSISFLQLEDVM